MSVVGFDIGNENCVVAAVKQQSIDVLLNDESKRETPAVVSFTEKQRLIGSAGAASVMMNPKSTVSQLKRLIGRRFDEPGVQNEIRLLPFQVSAADDGGILIHVRYLNEERVFTPVQVLGMLLSHLKKMTEIALESEITDCVIGVPSYFTDLQRRAYLDAAAIAGLRPLRLMHDGAATALEYGIYKTDAKVSTFVVFVDVGHCDTQVSLAAFTSGKMRMLAHAFDRDLGGRDFDEILFQYFAKQFKEQYKIDVCSSIRACIRLRTACEKLKKVLSANAEAPISIECLMDEKDVKSYIKREDFERLSSDWLERIVASCRKVLIDSRLTVDRIHSVELVGSGSRIPAISRVLTEFFRREPSRTLNSSECIARGCALHCAMLSPIFRVRDYEVQDSFPFSVGFLTDEGFYSKLSSNILFRKNQHIPSIKMLTFHRSQEFNMEANYADRSELPPGISQKISHFTVGPFQSFQNVTPKVKVRVQLNLHGIIAVESATLIEDETSKKVTTAKTHSNLDHVDHNFGYGASDGGTDVANKGSKFEFRCPPVEGVAKEKFNEDDGARQGYVKKLEIPVKEVIFGGMTAGDLLEAQALETRLALQDKIVEQTKERKNALEAYVYEIRNKLFDRFRGFANDSEKEDISRSLRQTEEWLYGEGEDEFEMVYSMKIEELKKLIGPVENRYKEEEARAQAARDLLECIVGFRMAAKSFQASNVISECDNAEQWIREKMQLHNSLPKHVDPVLWSSEIKQKIETLNTSCQHELGAKSSPSKSEDCGCTKSQSV